MKSSNSIAKLETWNSLLSNFVSKQSGNEIWLVYLILQQFLYQKIIWKMCPSYQFQALLNFQRIFYKKESKDVCMLLCTNFVKLLLHILYKLQNEACFKISFSTKSAWLFANAKGFGTSVQVSGFVESFG